MEQTLSHHGVKGQHWGVKNGPPYPLNSETHNAIVKGHNPGTTTKKSSTGVKKKTSKNAKKLGKSLSKWMNTKVNDLPPASAVAKNIMGTMGKAAIKTVLFGPQSGILSIATDIGTGRAVYGKEYAHRKQVELIKQVHKDVGSLASGALKIRKKVDDNIDRLFTETNKPPEQLVKKPIAYNTLSKGELQSLYRLYAKSPEGSKALDKRSRTVENMNNDEAFKRYIKKNHNIDIGKKANK